MSIKPIETVYNGYKFRSRLEARWAVFFDAMGFEYYYEFEGFDLGEAGWYLPDFYLSRVKMWAEVKPVEFNEDELKKIIVLATSTGEPCLMLVGPPSKRAYHAIESDTVESLARQLAQLAAGPPSEEGDAMCNYALSHFHNYYTDENRFYSYFCIYEFLDGTFDDMDAGIIAARQARFEYGSKGKK